MGADVTQRAELTVVLQLEDLKGLGDDLSLLGVVRSRDAVEDFKFGQSGSTTSSLVGQHTTDNSPEDSGRSFVVLNPATRIVIGSLI